MLPLASLWHTVHRVAALNAIKISELPFDMSLGGRATAQANLLFNETLRYGANAGEALSVSALAAALGEPVQAFAWSHFGGLPQSCGCLFLPFLRICPMCLAQGYHSALFSVRLLTRCPLHQCAFVEDCACGQRFNTTVDRQALLRAGHCACGRTAYFTANTCRRPSMEPEALRALLPIAAWLQEMTKVSRPVPAHARLRQAHNRVFLSSLTIWCDKLGIGYPAELVPTQRPASFSWSETPVGKSSPLRQAPGASADGAASRRRSLWRDNEATTIYRAMLRHLRRHVARATESFAVGFLLDPNPLAMARAMRDDRRAMVAFAEMLFCYCMERLAMQRRWPYRSPHGLGWRIEDRLDDPAVEAGHEGAQGLSPDARAWVVRQAAAAMVTHAWRRAQGTALAAVRSGLADWTGVRACYSTGPGIGQADEISPNWYLAPPPYQVTWATALVGNRLRFVSSPAHVRIDWTLPLPNKAARVRAWHRAEEARLAVVDRACHGPTLTWSEREGWQVCEAARPTGGQVKRHWLMVGKGVRVHFWVFVSDGRFVARGCEVAVQAFGESAREAIHALRAAVRQFRRRYELPKAEVVARPALPVPCRRDLEESFELQVMQAFYWLGFWGGSWRFKNLALEYLSKDRRLPEPRRCEGEGEGPTCSLKGNGTYFGRDA